MTAFLGGLGALAAVAVAVWHPFGRKVLITMAAIVGLFVLWMVATR